MTTPAILRTDDDGNVQLELGPQYAGCTVTVNQQSASDETVTLALTIKRPAESNEQWIADVMAFAGSIDDEAFRRYPQPPLEDRGEIFPR